MAQQLDISKIEATASATLEQVTHTISTLGVKVVAAIVILGVGWLCARLARALSGYLLRRLGSDRLADRLGLTASLGRAGLRQPALSHLLAGAAFWLILSTFFLLSISALEIRAITAVVDRLLIFLPRVLGAALILLAGVILGRMARDFLWSAVEAPAARTRLAGATNAVIVITAVALAVEQLGVDTEIVVILVTAIVAAAGVSMGVALALGARGVISHILAGHFLRQRFRVGEDVEVEGRRGTVTQIGAVDTVLRDGETSVSIPNAMLLDCIARR